MSMRTVALTLRPTPEQLASLERTRVAWVTACTYLSGLVWDTHTFRPYALQKIAYHATRERTGLLAQLTVRAIKVVCDSYQADKSVRHALLMPTPTRRG